MITITTVENAINRWRERFPSDPATCAVCSEISALGNLYASMVYFKQAGEYRITEKERRQNGQVNLGLPQGR